MKPLTVKELKKECEKQILFGNGDRVIMISQDDEGNDYHYLWYSFITPEEYEKPVTLHGETFEIEFNYHNEDVAKKEDTIILG